MKNTLNKKGQHTIEAIILLTLVVATVVIIGPYVIRSINAYFFKQEQDVHDSFDEQQTPFKGGTTVPDCKCEWRQPCDTPPCCGFGGCRATEVSQVYVCDPIGCLPTQPPQCVPDPNCCEMLAGACGAGACAGTEIEKITVCGSGTAPTGSTTAECNEDPICARCVLPVFGSAQKCLTLGDPNDEKGLVVNKAYEAVAACSGKKCEMRCVAGTFPVSGGRGCCPTNFQLSGGNECVCPSPFVLDANGNCVKSGRWINSLENKSCARICKDHGLRSALSPEKMKCASGEDRPVSGDGVITYPAGCWNGCSPVIGSNNNVLIDEVYWYSCSYWHNCRGNKLFIQPYPLYRHDCYCTSATYGIQNCGQYPIYDNNPAIYSVGAWACTMRVSRSRSCQQARGNVTCTTNEQPPDRIDCYRGGQVVDLNATDLRVACYCE